MESSLVQRNNLSQLSDSDYLATLGYIEKRDSTSAYNLSKYLTRQEALLITMKLPSIQIPESYICRGVFRDVSPVMYNSSICRIVENALERGIITQEGGNDFKPEEHIPLVEAVSMLLRASNI